MRRSFGKLSHPAIGHTIRKALRLSSPFDFSTSSVNDGGSGGGGTIRGRGTVSKPEFFRKDGKALFPQGWEKRTPPSSLSSVVSGAAAGGGKPAQATTPVGNNKVEEEVNKAEDVMICIDNSVNMKFLEPFRYRLQINCIRSYCRAKLESNPKNSIGLLTMGTFEVKNNLFPTSDLDEILHNLKYQLFRGGGLDFKDGIESAWWYLPPVDKPSKKRMLFFTGGPINLDIEQAKAAGKWLKQLGVAVDVVNFWRKGRYTSSKRALDAFVAAVNNDNNSHIEHVKVNRATHFKDVLFSTRQLFLEEGEIVRNKKANDPLGKKHDEPVKETTGNGRW